MSIHTGKYIAACINTLPICRKQHDDRMMGRHFSDKLLETMPIRISSIAIIILTLLSKLIYKEQ